MIAGTSGSHTADTAAIGSVMIPSMIRKDYAPAFATTVVAVPLGILFLPSPLIIFYGLLTGTSISALFLAGLSATRSDGRSWIHYDLLDGTPLELASERD